jgi:hypothetical protein
LAEVRLGSRRWGSVVFKFITEKEIKRMMAGKWAFLVRVEIRWIISVIARPAARARKGVSGHHHHE